MQNVTVINIEWEKVLLDKKNINTFDSSKDYGLYQIYGNHPCYGEDALLYIGQANDQTSAKRLNNRYEFIECAA